jgi:hypothetical protein
MERDGETVVACISQRNYCGPQVVRSVFLGNPGWAALTPSLERRSTIWRSPFPVRPIHVQNERSEYVISQKFPCVRRLISPAIVIVQSQSTMVIGLAS